MITEIDADHAEQIHAKDRKSDAGPAEKLRVKGQHGQHVIASDGERITPVDATSVDSCG